METRASTNLVLVGSWNVAILTPQWIAHHLPWLKVDGKAIPVEVALGIGQRLRFSVADVLIQPSPNRLDLVAKTEAEAVYDTIARIASSIVEKLPHTPITAVGHNVAFRLTAEEKIKKLQGVDLDDLQGFYRDVAGGSAVNQLQVKHAVDFSTYTLNITYMLEREQSVIDLNYHYVVGGGSDVRSMLSEFPKNIASAGEISQRLVELR